MVAMSVVCSAALWAARLVDQTAGQWAGSSAAMLDRMLAACLVVSSAAQMVDSKVELLVEQTEWHLVDLWDLHWAGMSAARKVE